MKEKMTGILRALFPHTLWTRRFLAAWLGAFVTTLAFDVLWSLATNWKGLGFVTAYLFAAVLALLLAMPAVLTRRRWVQVVVLLVYDMWLMANVMYARTYYAVIPPASYALVDNVMQFGDSILASVKWYDFCLPLIAVAAGILMGRRGVRPAMRPYWLTVCVGVAVCAATAWANGGLFGHISYLKSRWNVYSSPAVVYTLPADFVYELFETIEPVDNADIEAAERYLAEHRQIVTVQTQGADSVRPQRDNLVLVIVESLEGWPIGKTVEGQAITPNLDGMLADSATWACLRVQSQAGIGRSIDGQLLISSGLTPTDKFVYSMRYQDSHYPSLAKELHRALGTKSYLLSGDRANAWNQGLVARAFAFDDMRYRTEWDCSESFTHPRNPPDKSLVRQAVDKMRTGDIWPSGQRAFVELITYSSHFPFRIPAEERSIDLKGEYPEHLRGYIEAVNYTDGALGMLVDYLRSRPDWESTMVVIVGDHEGLATARAEALAHPVGGQIVDSGLFVPMIVLNAPVPGRRDAVMGQVDVYSTVLDQMGVRPQWPGLGFSGVSPDKRTTSPALPCLTVDYAAGYPGRPGRVDGLPLTAADSAQVSLIDRQARTGATIIAADMLSGRGL